MSTLINALTGANRSSSVLGAIANPAQVNPLAAIQGAAQTAGSIYDVRAKQAEQAIGGILQQSTDANGNIDYNKAHSLAAAAGPVVQMGMQRMLLNTSQLRNEQIGQSANLERLRGMSAISLLKNPSDQNVNSIFANLGSSGLPADQVEQERQRVLAMSPVERMQYAEQHGMYALDQLHQTVGQTTSLNVGNRVVPMTTTQPSIYGPGSVSSGPGALPLGLSPEELNKVDMYPDMRRTLPDGSPNKNYLNLIPMTKGDWYRSQGVDVTTGTTGGGGAGGGGGGGRATPPPPPGPPELGTGRPVPPALKNPNAPANAPPANAPPAAPVVQPLSSTPQMSRAPWAPAAPAASPAPAAAPPAAPGAAEPPIGSVLPGPAVVERGKASAGDFDSEMKAGRDAAPMQANLSNMLTDLGKFAPGSGAGFTEQLKKAVVSWSPRLASGLGIDPGSVAGQEDFNKTVNQILTAQQGGPGGSDKRMGVAEAATPHDKLSPQGAQLIVHKLQGNYDYIQARAQLAQKWPGSQQDYPGFQSSIQQLDPRVFQIWRMSDREQAEFAAHTSPQVRAEIAKNAQWARDHGFGPPGAS